jgi:hypothetical protein
MIIGLMIPAYFGMVSASWNSRHLLKTEQISAPDVNEAYAPPCPRRGRLKQEQGARVNWRSNIAINMGEMNRLMSIGPTQHLLMDNSWPVQPNNDIVMSAIAKQIRGAKPIRKVISAAPGLFHPHLVTRMKTTICSVKECFHVSSSSDAKPRYSGVGWAKSRRIVRSLRSGQDPVCRHRLQINFGVGKPKARHHGSVIARPKKDREIQSLASDVSTAVGWRAER